ncbi:MAG: serine/threonine protein kinase [Bacteroidales bacterium]|nr:serine/threonine protein kinase [Bacteroidales bacterium]
MLQILIESALKDGSVSDSDKDIIYKKAQQMGIGQAEVDKMIQDAIEIQNGSDLESGFIAMEDVEKTIIDQKDNAISPPPPPPPPNSFEQSKFSDIKPLSYQGAMSIVFQAKMHGKWIIIKRIKPEFKEDKKYRELFIREFENAYHLDHPHIVRLIDKGEDSEGLYYTMEYIDGRPLGELIKDTGLNNERLSENIARQILDALSYVHKKQIFHRDLKPDNIYVTFRGDNVKILDFGLAAADTYEDKLSKAGTPRYAAPEQMNKNDRVDQRADIYAFGKIFLEMLTGSVHSKDCSTIKNDSYRYIVEKSLADNPEDRFHDCDEVIYLLNNKNAIPVQEKNIGRVDDKNNKPKNTNKSSADSKKFSVIPVIIIAVVAVAVGAYFLFFNGGSNNNSNNNNINTTEIYTNAQNLAEKGKFDDAIDLLNGIEPATDSSRNFINEYEEAKNNFAAAESLYTAYNLVGAMELYNNLQLEYELFGEAKTKYTECLDIYTNLELKDLVHEQHSGQAGDPQNNLFGFRTKDGYLIFDYQFDDLTREPTNGNYNYGYYVQKTNLIPVKKDGKWGFISKNKETIEFVYDAITSVQNRGGNVGVIVKQGSNYYHLKGNDRGGIDKTLTNP